MRNAVSFAALFVFFCVAFVSITKADTVPGIVINAIRNQNTLQSGATFYVSSGTVRNVNVNVLKFSDGTTQTTAATGGETVVGPV